MIRFSIESILLTFVKCFLQFFDKKLEVYLETIYILNQALITDFYGNFFHCISVVGYYDADYKPLSQCL